MILLQDPCAIAITNFIIIFVMKIISEIVSLDIFVLNTPHTLANLNHDLKHEVIFRNKTVIYIF